MAISLRSHIRVCKRLSKKQHGYMREVGRNNAVGNANGS